MIMLIAVAVWLAVAGFLWGFIGDNDEDAHLTAIAWPVLLIGTLMCACLFIVAFPLYWSGEQARKFVDYMYEKRKAKND